MVAEKRLYRVEVEDFYYAWAEDEQEAERLYDDACRDSDPEFCVIEATVASLDPNWADSIPYGTDDDRTCEELLGCAPADLAEAARLAAEKAAWDAHPKLPLDTAP